MRQITRDFRALVRNPIAAFRFARIKRFISSRLPADLIKFLIISAPRSGSSLLCGILNSHSKIVCFYEMFHREAIFYGPHNITRYNFGTLIERDKYPAKFLAKIYSSQHGFKAVGVKMFNGHNNIVLSALIKNTDIKKIILRRSAALHAFSSQEIARITKQYQSVGQNNLVKPAKVRVKVNIQAFKAYVNERQAFYDRVQMLIGDQSYLDLDYVDIVKRTNVYKRIPSFLGLHESADMKAIHQKQNPAKLQDRIKNFDEICTALRGTKYASYIEEEL